jgi:hypothetical protein
MLVELVRDRIWHVQAPVSFAGVGMKTRMSVVRLADGKLWIHSPIGPGPALRQTLHQLGDVAYVCAPNRFHYLFAEEFMASYPQASLFVAPGLPKKRPALRYIRVLANEPEPEWDGDLDQLLFEGMPNLNEVVWLHRKSKTLILTDLCSYFKEDAAAVTRLLVRMLGVYRTFGMSRTMRLMVKDRNKARASRDRILNWDFERVIVAHEHIVTRNGKDAVADALAWLG